MQQEERQSADGAGGKAGSWKFLRTLCSIIVCLLSWPSLIQCSLKWIFTSATSARSTELDRTIFQVLRFSTAVSSLFAELLDYEEHCFVERANPQWILLPHNVKTNGQNTAIARVSRAPVLRFRVLIQSLYIPAGTSPTASLDTMHALGRRTEYAASRSQS